MWPHKVQRSKHHSRLIRQSRSWSQEFKTTGKGYGGSVNRWLVPIEGFRFIFLNRIVAYLEDWDSSLVRNLAELSCSPQHVLALRGISISDLLSSETGSNCDSWFLAQPFLPAGSQAEIHPVIVTAHCHFPYQSLSSGHDVNRVYSKTSWTKL